jgi:4-diphosphocytidyl-2-C-methyl-D-erythritol kinase
VLYRCYAKVNLTLEVLRRREDGYHDLASVVHTINLADDLSIEPADELLVRVEGLDAAVDDNLVTRAARLLASTGRVTRGAKLTLLKRIPAAAGLGGGSSDAATTLVGLNAYWGTRLGYRALADLALQLGSDVPLFLRGGAALMTGRGDDLHPLPPLPAQSLVLLVPRTTLANKTAVLYGALQPADFSSGEVTREVAERLEQRIPLKLETLRNAFDRPARAVFPGLDVTWSMAEERSQRQFHLTGAGPTIFTFTADRAEAREVAATLQQMGLEAYAVRTVKHARASTRFRTRPPIEYA